MADSASTDELSELARGGDGDAFEALVAPYRSELLTHCYRMLGSLHDAEDVLQESLLAAWRGLSGFEQRSSLRTWLYRITTNRCLNFRRSMQRRRAKEWEVPGLQPPAPTRQGEVVWLEPLPARLSDVALSAPTPPDAVYERSESISLAFITALQHLPPRQVAVLVLRDVLGYPAAEVAEMLGTTLEAANSALKRARARMRVVREAAGGADGPVPAPESSAELAITGRFARAYEAADIGALVGLFTEDVFLSMPPIPLEYVGRELVGQFISLFFSAGRSHRVVPTRANGQPALGLYVKRPDGSARASSLMVLTIAGDGISALTRFEPGLLEECGLPQTLPAT